MSDINLEVISGTAARLKRLAVGMNLSADAQERAFQLANLKPVRAAWVGLVDRALLICGAVLVIAGVMAFFAFNWADLHKFVKFALIQAALVACVVYVSFKDINTLPGKTALFAAAVLVGVLLAVYGQVYQTGADPYGLFLTWALLIIAWAWISRNPGLWLLVLVLLNLTVVLYWQQIVAAENLANNFIGAAFGPFAGVSFSFVDFKLAQLLFCLNSAAILLWEYLARRDIPWMKSRTFPRLISLLALYPIVVNSVYVILVAGEELFKMGAFVSPLLFFVSVIFALYYFSQKRVDMFLLSVSLLSVIVVVTSMVARWLSGGFDTFLLLSLLVIGQSAGAAHWLRKVGQDRGLLS